MARREDLEAFAKEHDLKIGTIADLIQYRALNEQTIEQVSEHPLDTWYGEFRLVAFRDTVDGHTHVALVKGEIDENEEVLVRVHQVDPLRDLMSAKVNGRTGWNMHRVLEAVAGADTGVVILLGQDEDTEPTLNRLQAFFDGTSSKPAGPSRAYRNIGTGSQILKALGVRKMRLLSSPMKFNALSGFGLEITEYVEADQ